MTISRTLFVAGIRTAGFIALLHLCVAGNLGAQTVYTGTLTGFTVHLQSGCPPGAITDTTTNLTDPNQVLFGPFSVSCNGFTIVLSNVGLLLDPTVTATQGAGHWVVSPPQHPFLEFTSTLTAGSTGGAKLQADTYALTPSDCPQVPDSFFTVTGPISPIVRTMGPCSESFMPTDVDGLKGSLGVTIGAFFASTVSSPGIVVDIVGHYTFTPAVPVLPTTITIDRIEVVQVIQDSQNSIDLVKDKSAEVRVYAKASKKLNVKAKLFAPLRSAAAPITIYGTLDTALPDPNSGQSLNFQTDGAWVAQGTAYYQVIITATGESASADSGSKLPPVIFKNNGWPTAYIIAPIIVCELNLGCPGGAGGLQDLSGFTQKVFPVADAISDFSGIQYLEPQTMTVDSSQTGYAKIEKKFKAFYILLLGAGAAPDQLVGWFDSQGLLRGKTAVLGRHLQLLYASSDSDLNQVRLASHTAEAIASTNSQPYVTDLTGFDPQSNIVRPAGLRALQATNVNAPADTWITGTLYTSLMQAFNSTPASALARKREPLASAAPYIVITGDIFSGKTTGGLDPGFLSSSTVPADPSDPNGNYCLHFSGGTGGPADHCFTVDFPGGRDFGTFAVRAPFPAGANRVALVAHSAAGNGNELAAIAANATAPKVQITSPVTGASLNAGSLSVNWSGTGGSPMSYNLLTSGDGGATWKLLDTGLTDNTYSVDTTHVSGGPQVMFQVQASDGLTTVSSTVGPLTITQTPKLTPPVGVFDFGKVLTGQGLDRFIPLRNTGTGPLTVKSIASDTAAFRVVSAAGPFTIGAGGQRSVQVRGNAAAAGVLTANLKIATNDPTLANASVPLKAKAFDTPAPTVKTSATTVDFGNVLVGQSTTVSFPVGNSGPGLLTVSAIKSSNGAYSATAPAFPFTVRAGQQQDVTMKFAPSTMGSQTAVVTLTTDDPDSISATVNTTGTGIAAGSPTPAFTAAGLVNAGSYAGGGVSAGEIVTVFGSNLGPAKLAGLTLGTDGKVTTSAGGTQLLFDGVPAPMIYSVAGQISAVVPYAVATQTSTQMQIVYQGVKSNITVLPVLPAVPALFTADASGKGQGALLNQDQTPNSATNPAVPGSVVILYATGEGQTNPEGIDGLPGVAVLPAPALPVTVTIGGLPAKVLYAGAAPYLVAGVLQVNVVVPAGLSGNQPVVLTVGTKSSPPGVTLALK